MRCTLVVCLALAAACHSKSQAAGAGPDSGSASGTLASSTATAQVKLSEDTLKRYMDFDKERRPALRQFIIQSKVNGHVGFNLGAMSEFEKTRQALLRKWNLTDGEEKAAEELFEGIAMRRAQWTQMGSDRALAEYEKEAAKPPVTMNLPANASPQQKEFAKSNEALSKSATEGLRKSVINLKRLRDLQDLRDKYGDAIVDYALKNGGESLISVSTVINEAALGTAK